MPHTAGAAGADVAIAAADVALFTNDLRCLPHVVRLGRLVRTKVAQNVALAVSTKVRHFARGLCIALRHIVLHVHTGMMATQMLCTAWQS